MIKFTDLALANMTGRQRRAILRLSKPNVDIQIYIAFELPKGFLGFNQIFSETHTIVGGIDREGNVST